MGEAPVRLELPEDPAVNVIEFHLHRAVIVPDFRQCAA